MHDKTKGIERLKEFAEQLRDLDVSIEFDQDLHWYLEESPELIQSLMKLFLKHLYQAVTDIDYLMYLAELDMGKDAIEVE